MSVTISTLEGFITTFLKLVRQGALTEKREN